MEIEKEREVTEDQLFVPLQAGNDITLTHCIEM
jgi:hypothetical protein